MCMSIILMGLFFLSNIDNIKTIKYKQYGQVMCEEVYVNGNLNTSPCPQNTVYFPKMPQWEAEIKLINWT